MVRAHCIKLQLAIFSGQGFLGGYWNSAHTKFAERARRAAIDKRQATAVFDARWYDMIHVLGLQVDTPSRFTATTVTHSVNAINLSHPKRRRFIPDGRSCLPTFAGITNQDGV
jgi:hypothetical protein